LTEFDERERGGRGGRERGERGSDEDIFLDLANRNERDDVSTCMNWRLLYEGGKRFTLIFSISPL
jgi:hypothetical protein